MNTAMIIEETCTVLLERALLGKSVCAFGEDGFGLFGRNDLASWFTVKSIDVLVIVSDPVQASAVLRLEGYDSRISGHIMTDKNFEISLKSYLKAARLDPRSLKWQDDANNQGVCTVTMNIDLGALM